MKIYHATLRNWSGVNAEGYFAKLAFLLKTKAAEKFYHRYMSDISMSRTSLYRRI
jgi:hypothetical protein